MTTKTGAEGLQLVALPGRDGEAVQPDVAPLGDRVEAGDPQRVGERQLAGHCLEALALVHSLSTVVFPVAHGEGNYVADDATLDRLEFKKLLRSRRTRDGTATRRTRTSRSTARAHMRRASW